MIEAWWTIRIFVYEHCNSTNDWSNYLKHGQHLIIQQKQPKNDYTFEMKLGNYSEKINMSVRFKIFSKFSHGTSSFFLDHSSEWDWRTHSWRWSTNRTCMSLQNTLSKAGKFLSFPSWYNSIDRQSVLSLFRWIYRPIRCRLIIVEFDSKVNMKSTKCLVPFISNPMKQKKNWLLMNNSNMIHPEPSCFLVIFCFE